MNNKILFDNFILKEYSYKLNEKKHSFQEDKNVFRYLCFKLNYFMKHITLPIIKKNSFFEAVIVEFRILPHIEFIIRNAIYKLGGNWSFTVICGTNNYEFVSTICKEISKNIKIIQLNYDNITQQEYSNLLMTEKFWNLLNGEKILIYQEDSLIFKNNIKDFIEYDFIGAPFPKESNDTPNCVGNGGLSLRTKIKMLEIIRNYSIYELNIESSTLNYMNIKKLTTPPEDVYFSKNMQEYNIGDVADWNTAYNFSCETIFNPNSFAGHQFWISTNKWREHIKQIFGYKIYTPKSDIKKYLKFIKTPISFDKTKERINAFDIDLYFFRKVNNLPYKDENILLNYLFKLGLNGFIYHTKQLINYFPNIVFYKFLDNIYTFYKNEVLTVQNFTNKYLYNSNFEFISNLLLNKKYDCLNDNYNQLLLVFIGTTEIGLDLVKKIIKYKNVQKDFNVAFCFNRNIQIDNIKALIKQNFDFYAIYYCKELGTDITPTLLMYNDIIKTHKFNHIIKLHTKGIMENYENLTNYLLSIPLEKLLEYKIDNCNCIGFGEYYLNLFDDKFNNKLKNDYVSNININNTFVAGTIFYTTDIIMIAVLNFIKNNNYRCYLINNLYDNNSINQTFSPIHFLERLFGVIKI
jgi:hypothetical protein